MFDQYNGIVQWAFYVAELKCKACSIEILTAFLVGATLSALIFKLRATI